MGKNSPSRYRRMGREDFEDGETNVVWHFAQRFPESSWTFKSHLQDYLDGWNQAKKEFDEEDKEKTEEISCILSMDLGELLYYILGTVDDIEFRDAIRKRFNELV